MDTIKWTGKDGGDWDEMRWMEAEMEARKNE